MAEEERWAPFPGAEGRYEISTLGNARHLAWRTDGVLRNLKPFYNKGYPFISIKFGEKNKKFPLHRCVLMAFDRMPFPGEEACHNDGDRSNAKFSNLRWASHSENELDKVLHGTGRQGERHPCCKLTESEVMKAKEMLDAGVTQREIAALFRVSQASVSLIKLGINWRHLPKIVKNDRLVIG